MKKIIFLILITLFLSACALTVKTNPTSSSGGDGGVFISADRGATWQQKIFVSQTQQKTVTIGNVDVAFFYFHPINQNTVYMSTLSNGLWKTDDLGETWVQTSFKSGNVTGFDIDPKNPDIMFVGYQNTVQKSIDAGKTWEVIYTNQPGNTINQVGIDSYNDQNIFAATSGGVLLKSEDQGTTWRILKQFPNKNLKRLIILKIDSHIMFLITQDGILRSNDNGVTWSDTMTQALNKVTALPINDFIFTDRNPSIMYVASNNGIVKSKDGGSSWVVVPTVIPAGTVPIQSIAINVYDENEIYFTAGSTFYKSQDDGTTWQTLKNVSSSRLFKVIAADPKKAGTLFLGTLLVKKK